MESKREDTVAVRVSAHHILILSISVMMSRTVCTSSSVSDGTPPSSPPAAADGLVRLLFCSARLSSSGLDAMCSCGLELRLSMSRRASSCGSGAERTPSNVWME